MNELAVQALGTVSTVFFFFSGWPAAADAITHGKTAIPARTSWCVWLGAVTMYIYLLFTAGFDLIITIDYGSTVVCWAIVLWYHYKPRPDPRLCRNCDHFYPFPEIRTEGACYPFFVKHTVEDDFHCNQWQPVGGWKKEETQLERSTVPPS